MTVSKKKTSTRRVARPRKKVDETKNNNLQMGVAGVGMILLTNYQDEINKVLDIVLELVK